MDGQPRCRHCQLDHVKHAGTHTHNIIRTGKARLTSLQPSVRYTEVSYETLQQQRQHCQNLEIYDRTMQCPDTGTFWKSLLMQEIKGISVKLQANLETRICAGSVSAGTRLLDAMTAKIRYLPDKMVGMMSCIIVHLFPCTLAGLLITATHPSLLITVAHLMRYNILICLSS